MDEEKSPSSKEASTEEEFHFSEAEVEEANPFATEAEAEATSTAGSKINRRNVLIALGFVIIALSIYKLAGVFFGERAPTKVVKAVATTTAPTTQPSVAPPQAPTVQVEMHSAVPSSPLQPVDSGTSQQQMDSISGDLTKLSDNMESMQAALTGISQQLQSLNAALQDQQQAIVMLKAQKKTVSAKAVPASVPTTRRISRPAWFIRAMIPGRAWLASGTRSLSVSVGDRLPGYGKITKMSVVNGIVRTSSGVMIRVRDDLVTSN